MQRLGHRPSAIYWSTDYALEYTGSIPGRTFLYVFFLSYISQGCYFFIIYSLTYPFQIQKKSFLFDLSKNWSSFLDPFAKPFCKSDPSYLLYVIPDTWDDNLATMQLSYYVNSFKESLLQNFQNIYFSYSLFCTSETCLIIESHDQKTNVIAFLGKKERRYWHKINQIYSTGKFGFRNFISTLNTTY